MLSESQLSAVPPRHPPRRSAIADVDAATKAALCASGIELKRGGMVQESRHTATAYPKPGRLQRVFRNTKRNVHFIPARSVCYPLFADLIRRTA